MEIISSSAGPDLEQLDLLVKLPAGDWPKRLPRGPCQPNVFYDPLIQKKKQYQGVRESEGAHKVCERSCEAPAEAFLPTVWWGQGQ